MKKVVLYINQFFGQIGGEDKADFAPIITTEPNGVSLLLSASLADAKVTHTIICGDNFMGSRQDEAVQFIVDSLKDVEFDAFVAGPAFQAGRYGSACGNACKAVMEAYHVPVVTSMHVENPGVEMFRSQMPILQGGHSAASMKKNVKAMADYLNKVLAGQPIGPADEEGYFPTGHRHQVWRKDGLTAAKRTVAMLLKKVHGEPFTTELPIPKSDRVAIAAPIHDLSHAKIAMVTTGGVVPVDNPDRIQSASATRWGRYDMTGMDRLESGVFKTIHAGYDPAVCDANPNVCVPLDAMRNLEKAGVIGELDNYFYTTVGTGTTQAEATRMGTEIAQYLHDEKVDGVIMVST